MLLVAMQADVCRGVWCEDGGVARAKARGGGKLIYRRYDLAHNHRNSGTSRTFRCTRCPSQQQQQQQQQQYHTSFFQNIQNIRRPDSSFDATTVLQSSDIRLDSRRPPSLPPFGLRPPSPSSSHQHRDPSPPPSSPSNELYGLCNMFSRLEKPSHSSLDLHRPVHAVTFSCLIKRVSGLFISSGGGHLLDFRLSAHMKMRLRDGTLASVCLRRAPV